MKLENIIGHKFGRLSVVDFAPSKDGHTRWECVCKCGNTTVVRRGSLVNGLTTSCGCYRSEITIERSVSNNTFTCKGKITEMYDTRGNCTLIDTEDVEKIRSKYWSLQDSYWYSQRNKKRIRLHRFILSTPENEMVDHEDGNPSNNVKSNLRICTPSQNCMNHKLYKNNTSGFSGVCFLSKLNRYLAVIKINNKSIYLGKYKTLDEAVKVRKEAELKYFKEFRRKS